MYPILWDQSHLITPHKAIHNINSIKELARANLSNSQRTRYKSCTCFDSDRHAASMFWHRVILFGGTTVRKPTVGGVFISFSFSFSLSFSFHSHCHFPSSFERGSAVNVRTTWTTATRKASNPSCSTGDGLALRRASPSRSPRPTRTAGTTRRPRSS